MVPTSIDVPKKLIVIPLTDGSMTSAIMTGSNGIGIPDPAPSRRKRTKREGEKWVPNVPSQYY